MIHGIRLQNFRSYTDESFEFGSGVNIIVGPNASGKTNLLESLQVSSMGNSYRVKDQELLRSGADWYRLDVTTDEGMRTLKCTTENGLIKKKYDIYGQAMTRLSLQKSIPVVLFEPNHLLLMIGGPELRREYLDNLLESIIPGFATIRKNYKRALSQRNRLLKQGDAATSQLFAWNIRLSELGGMVADARIKLVARLNESLPELYGSLSNSTDEVTVTYASKIIPDQYSSDMLYKLEQTTQTDIIRGFTGYGPHRDDMELRINGRPMLLAASRGETRTTLLALKVIELQIIEKARQQKPILLLDDVFSELDGSRRRSLTGYLEQYQTFLTTTDADIVLKHFTENCQILPITKG